MCTYEYVLKPWENQSELIMYLNVVFMALNFYSLGIILRITRFNILKFYMLITLRLRVLYGSHDKQRLLSYTALAEWFCITEVESVYCAVRTESLYKTDTFSL
jgi:hypothetical protein